MRLIRPFFFLLVLCVLAGAVSWSVIAQEAPADTILAASTTAKSAIGYDRVQSALQQLQSAGIPVRVPKLFVYSNKIQLPNLPFAVGGLNTNLQTNAITGYSFTLVDSPYCKGALNCSLGYIEAQKLRPIDKSIEDFYAFMRDPRYMSSIRMKAPHDVMWVKLPNGRSVYVVPWVESGMGGKGFEQAVWDEGGYRYTIGLKGGDKDWLLQMVNSAFE